MYKVEITPVIGLPQFAGWSHVASNFSRLGQSVLAFAVQGEHAGNVGRDLTELFTTRPVETTAGFHELLHEMQATATQMDTQLSLAASLFTPGKMVLAVLNGDVFLRRQDRMGVLLKSRDSLRVIEGKHHPQDIVVLSTQQAEAVLPEIELKFKTGYELDSVITSIIPGLHSIHDSSLSSLAFITGGTHLEDVEPPPPPVVSIDATTNSGEEIAVELSTPPSGVAPVVAELGQTFAPPAPGKLHQLVALGLKLGGQAWGWLRRVPLKQLSLQVGQTMASGVRGLGEAVRRVRSKEGYLPAPNFKQQRRRWYLFGGLILILLVGLMWGVITARQQLNQAKQAIAGFDDQVAQAQQQLDTQPLESRQAIQQVITDLENLQQEARFRWGGKKLINAKLTSVKELYDQISSQQAVEQLEVFYDLRLVDAEFVASQVEAVADTAVFLDRDRKKAIVLTLSSKQAREISLDTMARVTDLTVDENTITFLGDGIFQTKLKTEAPVERVIDEGDSNRDATLIKAFASYLYVLNPAKRNIYRYAYSDGAFTDPIGWVSGATSLDFGQATSWSIDGQVWVGTKDGQVVVMASGSQVDFAVKGLETPLSKPVMVVTRDDLAKVYLLESGNSRLLVLNKDGNLVKEISSASLASTTGLLVDEPGAKAYAVSGSIVYAIPLP